MTKGWPHGRDEWNYRWNSYFRLDCLLWWDDADTGVLGVGHPCRSTRDLSIVTGAAAPTQRSRICRVRRGSGGTWSPMAQHRSELGGRGLRWVCSLALIDGACWGSGGSCACAGLPKCKMRQTMRPREQRSASSLITGANKNSERQYDPYTDRQALDSRYAERRAEWSSGGIANASARHLILCSLPSQLIKRKVQTPRGGAWQLPRLKLGRVRLWKEVKAKNRRSNRKMSDAIFVAKKASCQLKIGDKKEIDKAVRGKPHGIRLTPTSRYVKDKLFRN
jgi:8-oxo-dGTP diphosphatase